MKPAIATIRNLDHEGRGVARVEGKTVFIEGALPQETVHYRVLRRKKHFDEAELADVVQASAYRVTPACPHYERCGGCALQHVRPEVQVAYKQQILEAQLQRLGKVRPQYYLPPIYGRYWGYRERARLQVAADEQGRISLGFQERHSHRLVDVHTCPVLAPQLSARLGDIRRLLAELWQAGARIQAIGLHHSEGGQALTLMVKTLPAAARHMLQQAAENWLADGWQLWLQQDNQAPASVSGEASRLYYRLPEYGLQLPYRPGDFTQINAQTNALLVRRALNLLAPQPGERIADLFCGLGNFSLPLARQGAQVVGVEGEAGLVQRARENAQRNGIANVQFHAADLTADLRSQPWVREGFDALLLDPPRTGADATIAQLPLDQVGRIVYVSCHPGSLARDAGILVREHGYRLAAAGVMDMFPHTAHVESIAVFDPPKKG